VKFEVRAKAGSVNLMFLDDGGSVVLDVEAIPPDDANDLAKLIRRACRHARAGIDGAAKLANKPDPAI
jgi:hypothetical protein